MHTLTLDQHHGVLFLVVEQFIGTLWYYNKRLMKKFLLDYDMHVYKIGQLKKKLLKH